MFLAGNLPTAVLVQQKKKNYFLYTNIKLFKVRKLFIFIPTNRKMKVCRHILIYVTNYKGSLFYFLPTHT